MVILLGLFLICLTVLFHIGGTIVWAMHLHSQWQRVQPSRSDSIELGAPNRIVLRAFSMTTVVVLVLHLAEVLLWAVAYSLLPSDAGLNGFDDCVYFSMVTYTTLGYGDVLISDDQWRLLTGIQAMGGMLAFGWSSALLFAAAQQVVGHIQRKAS